MSSPLVTHAMLNLWRCNYLTRFPVNNKKVVHVGDKNHTGVVPKTPAQLLAAQYVNQFGELQKAYHQFVTINKSPIPHYEQFRHCRKRGRK